ncbi:MAG TPA: CheR family methyltransferase, partial [Alphaproteobacteria bacterium]|nr:CheR family methyltransferase [Alphaproteobacteria bacterium]
MTPADFETFATLVRQRSGLIVTADKAYLFESRLTPLLRTWNMTELSQLAEAVRMRRDEAIMRQITESMTTNESFFFRDNGQYEQLKKTLLPEFLKARATRKKLRIWSAACSSGQEAYSLGMLWLENAPLGWSIEILGTDLSAAMVDRARQGVYTQFEVQRGLPVTHLMRHFTQVEEGQWQVSEALRDIANFQEGNLVAGPHPAGPFDVIFCRNVLIYFD